MSRASIGGTRMNSATRGRPAQAGFSLIELMIVVVIIGIIAAIAYPSYQRNVRESNRTEAQGALVTLAALQERFFSDNNSYGLLGTTCTRINFPATTEHGYYTIAVTLPGTPPTEDTVNCRITANHASSYTLTATAAAAPQTADAGCTTLTLTSTGVKSPAACWR